MPSTVFKRWILRLVSIGVGAVVLVLIFAAMALIGGEMPKAEIGDRLNSAITTIIFLTFIPCAVLLLLGDTLDQRSRKQN